MCARERKLSGVLIMPHQPVAWPWPRRLTTCSLPSARPTAEPFPAQSILQSVFHGTLQVIKKIAPCSNKFGKLHRCSHLDGNICKGLRCPAVKIYPEFSKLISLRRLPPTTQMNTPGKCQGERLPSGWPLLLWPG